MGIKSAISQPQSKTYISFAVLGIGLVQLLITVVLLSLGVSAGALIYAVLTLLIVSLLVSRRNRLIHDRLLSLYRELSSNFYNNLLLLSYGTYTHARCRRSSSDENHHRSASVGRCG